jgi:RimJ/RimL family protein N-acetyltransferase
VEALTTVHTPRLLLRRLQEQDLGWMQRMDANVNVVGPAGVRSADESERLFGEQLHHWDQHGFGLWLAFDRTTLTCAGRGGLRHIDLEGKQVVQLGFGLFPKFWGQGLATEIAEASTQAAFDTLALKRLIALSLPTNLASRRVLQKVKFQYLRDVQYDGSRHVLYERLQA